MSDIEKLLKEYAILVIDEDGENLESFRQNFRGTYNIVTVGGVEEGLKEIAQREKEFAIVIADFYLPGGGREALERCKRLNPDIVTMLMVAGKNIEQVFRVIDCYLVNKVLLKPWNLDEMADLMEEGIRKYQNNRVARRAEWRFKMACEYLQEELRQYMDYQSVVGKDNGLKSVMEQVRRIAPSSGNVLILGEIGTGKELIARALHALSPRGGKLFIKLDTTELTPREIEQRLFGVEKPTVENLEKRAGLLELAEGSTLFIKDIAHLALETQVKLARALKEKEYERVGGVEVLPMNTRIIAASTENLKELLALRQFRSELFNELSAFTINLPPLRERKGDISTLVQFYVDKYSKALGKAPISVDISAMTDLEAYDWHGNVIELQAVLLRAVLLSQHEIIRSKDLVILPPRGVFEQVDEVKESPILTEEAGGLDDNLAKMEKRAIKEALKKAKGRKSGAARLLGINRSTLYYRMAKYGIKTR